MINTTDGTIVPEPQETTDIKRLGKEIEDLKNTVNALGDKILTEHGVSPVDFQEYKTFFEHKYWIEVEEFREMPNLSMTITMETRAFIDKFDVWRDQSWVKRNDHTTTFYVTRDEQSVLYICKVPSVLIFKINEVMTYFKEMQEKEYEHSAMVYALEHPDEPIIKKGVEKALKNKQQKYNTSAIIWVLITLMWSIIFLMAGPFGGAFP